MGSIASEGKPHAVCIPFPAQGHINAMLKMAKVLYSKGFHITFIHTESNYNRVIDSADRSSLCGLANFRFEKIPADIQINHPPIHGPLWAPTRSLLNKLNEPTSDMPLPTCIVSDSFMSFTLELAAELGVPNIFLCPVSACSFMGFLYYKELMARDIVPLKSESDLTNGYLETVIDWIPGMKNIRLRDLPSYIRTTDPNDILLNFCKDEAQAALRATAIIMHTFDDLERTVLDALSPILPPVYPIGPLDLLCSQILDVKIKSIWSSLWKEDSTCMDWLQGVRAPGSVIYVNFGSGVHLTSQQLTEFAWGIANSGHNFLWVIRPDMVEGGSVVLPAEFLAETSTRGLVTSWCLQEEVLRHPSVGGFLTHCGWNSTMEAISAGVPVICWPVFADQPTNSRYLCKEWGKGLEIDGNVERDEVAKQIGELLEGDEGKEVRKNALKWKESAVRATELGGKSSLHLERLIKEVMFR
ncbi:7-deoxyloganetin glucosyltransferase-like [Iris pallida]|uniref:Glycosyltransferase n=1 Tax=Iris pallida TaxID=29817 RepID=A0AAX6HIG3_IRIPA|nr:7-deoxyloganetin glucosyltransferase-like [Iris pallida]